MNMMRAAENWLNNQRNNFFGETVTYIHYGEQTPVETQIVATRGRTIFRAEDSYGMVIRVHSVDFLVSGDALTEYPQKGDEIRCGNKKYEVLAPNNEPVWRWSDSGEKTMRIHTKETGVCD